MFPADAHAGLVCVRMQEVELAGQRRACFWRWALQQPANVLPARL